MKLLIQNFIKNLFSNNKNIYYIVVFIFLYFIFWDTTFAEGTTAAAWGTTRQTANTDVVLSALNEVLKWVAIVLTLWTNLIWWFLSPDWTTWKLVWLDKPLYRIWVMVSNVVYYIFAFIFIWIAFMNIIWKWDGYEIKSAIPRFIVWVLIVPFSWFIVQFTLSVSNVLTAAVLSLPMSNEIRSLNPDANEKKIPICVKWWIITTWDATSSKMKDERAETWTWGVKWTNYIIRCYEKKDMKLSEVFVWDGIYSIMYYYTYQAMKFDEIWRIFQWDVLAGVTSIVRAVFKIWFNIIFVIIYALLLLALIFVMFTRIMYLWMYTMLSPLFWLAYFFKKRWWDSFISKFNIKEFFSLAFLPVMVSAALVFWMIFIITASYQLWQPNQNWRKLVDSQGCVSIPKVLSWIDNKLCWKWIYHSEKWDIKMAGIESTNFWAFLVQLFGIMFLWLAVMAAIKTSKIVAEVARPFERIWKSVWEMIKKAPQNIPIIPRWTKDWKTQMMSSAWLSNRVWRITWALDQISKNSWDSFANKVWSWLWLEQFMKWITWLQKEFQKLESWTAIDKWTLLKELISKIDWTKVWSDPSYRTEVMNWLNKIKWFNLSDDDLKWSTQQIADKLSNKIGRLSDSDISLWTDKNFYANQRNLLNKMNWPRTPATTPTATPATPLTAEQRANNALGSAWNITNNTITLTNSPPWTSITVTTTWTLSDNDIRTLRTALWGDVGKFKTVLRWLWITDLAKIERAVTKFNT